MTHYSLYKQNAHINEAIPVFSSFFSNVSHARLSSLQQDVSFVCVYIMCVCVCECVSEGGFACMKRELDVNGSKLSNSLFFEFYSKCQFKTAGGRDNRYVHISPLTSICEVMYIHPNLNCRSQNRVLIIYTLCTSFLNPRLGPFTAS